MMYGFPFFEFVLGRQSPDLSVSVGDKYRFVAGWAGGDVGCAMYLSGLYVQEPRCRIVSEEYRERVVTFVSYSLAPFDFVSCVFLAGMRY